MLKVFPKGESRNSNGQCVVQIVGTAIFRANHWIPHQAFNDFYDYHHVTADEYATMKAGWKKDSGGSVAWQIELGEVFQDPKYLPSGSQDLLLCLGISLGIRERQYIIHIYF